MRTTQIGVVTLLLLAGSARLACAAEWTIDPSLKLTAGYDDNLRLTTDDKIETAIGIVSPGVVFSVESPTSGASGEAFFDFRRYEEDSDLNDERIRFTTRTFHNRERSRLGLDLSYIKDTTLDSQLEETGVVFDRIPRYRYDISPNWTWSLSERSDLTATYTYSNTQYDNSAGTGQVDYQLHAGRLALSRTLSERAVASASLSHTASDNENDVQSRNSGLQAGATLGLSETLSTSLFVGVRYTEADYSTTSLIPVFTGTTITLVPLAQRVSKSSWGTTFIASITKQFERGSIDLSATQGISNQINGTPVEVTRLSWNNNYNFVETFSGSLALVYYHSDTQTAAGQNLQRDFYTIEPRLRWQFAEFWNLSAQYRHKIQTYDNSDDDAIQNAAYLTLSYQWPRIAISR